MNHFDFTLKELTGMGMPERKAQDIVDGTRRLKSSFDFHCRKSGVGFQMKSDGTREIITRPKLKQKKSKKKNNSNPYLEYVKAKELK